MSATATRRGWPRSVQLEMAIRQQATARLLRELRKGAGKTQPDVAEAVGVTLRAYQEWEAGGTIRPENARKLAQVWNRSTTDFLAGDEDIAASPTPNQLDRIEAKLDTLISLLGGSSTSITVLEDEVQEPNGVARRQQRRKPPKSA